MKRSFPEEWSCFCGATAVDDPATKCQGCGHVACSDCAEGAGGVIVQCPGCDPWSLKPPKPPPRRCPHCDVDSAEKRCRSCNVEYCSKCVAAHTPCYQCNICNKLTVRRHVCRCGIRTCVLHFSIHVSTCPSAHRCIGCHRYSHIPSTTKLCVVPGCNKGPCPDCEACFNRQCASAVCREHKELGRNCGSCNLVTPTVCLHRVNGANVCDACWPRASALYLSLKYASPLMPPPIIKLVVEFAVKGGCLV